MKEKIKKKFNKNKKLIYTLLIALVLFSGYKVYGAYKEANPDIDFAVINLEERELIKSIKVDGQVLADYEIKMASEIPGIISNVYVKEGDFVKKGQLLAKLKDTDYRTQLNSAYVNINLNKASLEKTKNPNPNLDIDLEIAENNKEITLENIEKTQADIDFNISNLNTYLDQFLRLEIDDYFDHTDTRPVFTYRITSEREIEVLEKIRYDLGESFKKYNQQEEHTLDEAIKMVAEFENLTSRLYTASIDFLGFTDAEVEAKERVLSAMKTQISEKKNYLISLKTKLAELNNQLSNNENLKKKTENVVAQEDLKIAEEKVKQAQVSANNAYLQLQKTYIRAPKDGIVVDIFKEVGEYAAPSEPILKINSKNLYLEVDIPEVDIAKVKKGMPAEIKLDAFGDRIFNGTVDVIYPEKKEVFGVIYYRTKILFEQSDLENENILPGMSAEVKIIYQRGPVALSISRDVAKKEGDKYFVNILNNQRDSIFQPKFIKKYFATGFVGDDFVEVLDDNLKSLDIVKI